MDIISTELLRLVWVLQCDKATRFQSQFKYRAYLKLKVMCNVRILLICLFDNKEINTDDFVSRAVKDS